ncbi:MAG: hypothetical protein OET44_15560 [Gammaproteobacteria bacterium]|nr:hypothetical protein [Gammaproteobacteria bacterium]
MVLAAAAPIVSATKHTASLELFYGVWIGHTSVVQGRALHTDLAARDVDVAVWKTDTGIEMTLRNLSGDAPARITLHFVTTNSDTLDIKQTTPPAAAGEAYWARIRESRLMVFHSSTAEDGVEQLARYEYSISQGQMTLKHILSRNGEVLRTETVSLRRAKVVM